MMEPSSPKDQSSATHSVAANSDEAENLLLGNNSASNKDDGNQQAHAKKKIEEKYPSTYKETFILLTKFMLPLIVTQMVPDVAEQALNRGITSLAKDDMKELLASFGLAFYVTRFLSCGALELRNISIVLVHSKRDNIKMTIFCVCIGAALTLFQLIISVTPVGIWFIADVHQQPLEVAQLTCNIMAYLAPVSLLEAIAYYYEGGLIFHKLTLYAGIAKFTDFGLQVLFTLVLLFTPTSTEPILVPLFAMYAGYIGRLILSVGFWLVLVRRNLPLVHPTEKPVTPWKAFMFWLPLAIVRFVQTVSRPIINLVVSRTLAETQGKEAATTAVAVLTAVYPTGRFVFSWLNDLRAVVPTFHRATEHHRKLRLKTLGIYSAFCTATVFLVHTLLYIVPGPGYFIMHTILGLSKELAERSILPLKIFAGLCLCVGLRSFLTGILIMKKQTMFLTPSGVARLVGLIIVLATLPYSGISGAVLGITCLLLSFVVEALFLLITILILKVRPSLAEKWQVSCCKKKDEDADLKSNDKNLRNYDGDLKVEEALPMAELGSKETLP